MKLYTSVLTLAVIILIQINVSSQILNPGFESWTNNDPDGWSTTDIPGLWNTVSQSSDANTGSSAVRLEVVSVGGSAVPPLMMAGEDGSGFAISQRHGSLSGFYKYLPMSPNEILEVAVLLYKGDDYLGGGVWITNQTVNSYIQFSIPLDYISSETPDTAYIHFVIVDTASGSGSIGTYALVDDLSFGGPTDVQLENLNPISFNLLQNYPNPFNPSTKINFSITEQSYVELIVYDILGNEITKLVSDNYPAGEYAVDFDAENLPNGIYIAKMNAGKYSKAIKMTLLK